MTPQELKSSILSMAFQGQLTSQRPDENVNNILSICKNEKLQIISEGKYRNEPFRGAIIEHEYNIPENWCVMYISDMALFQEGPGILAKDFRSSGIPLIRISGMQTQHVSLEGCNYLDPEMVELRWKHFKLDYGDILISTSASMDKVCEVFEDCVGAIPYTGQIRFKMYGGISKEYFKWYVQSPLYIKQINEQQAGAAIKHYGPTHLKRMTIPIAPLAEQKRIVAKIEELLPLIERYEKAWSRLEDFNKRFPGDMQKSILQMAIQGKLVDQRPEEGTGDELYHQIQAEKQALIKAGKIKKQKPLSEIAEGEIPFELPESWKWVRFSTVIDVRDGTHDTPKYVATGIPLVTSKNLVDGRINFDTAKNISIEDATAINMRSRVDDGDILFAMIGTIGNPVLVKKEREFSIKNMALFKQINASLLDMKYVLFFLQIAQADMKAIANASVQSFVSLSTLRNYLFPLPPLAEQKRIVARLEELLPLCERLK